MPVVVTMTAIAILRGDDSLSAPFFDAELLAERLEVSLADASDERRQKAFGIVDQLERSLADYRTSVDASLDAYVEISMNSHADAADLIAGIEPLDQKRTEMLKAVVGHRQALLRLLDEQQWYSTFD